jgi:imidazolonepropionase-like amidohydrolase
VSGRLALLLGALLAAVPVAGAETLVIDAETVHPVAGAPIESGRIVIEGGRIASVGPADAVPAPEGARRLRAAVATPGLIDAHTSVGLAGLYNVRADRDQDERSAPNQADLRALDAFNPDEPLLRHQLEHGVTLVQAAPGPANPIAGQAGIFRTHGRTADAMAVRRVSALVMNLGEIPKATYTKEKKKLPTTRMGTAALLRSALLDGREYAAKRARASARGDDEKPPPARDLKREALALCATGELPAVFVAHRADDIVTAIRIAREYNLRFALAGATEGYLVADAIRESGAPVLVGPVMERVGSPQTLNASYENAARLAREGIRIAIRSGFESYVPKTRLVLFEAAVAAANGLGFDAALRAITLGAAEVLGVDERHGSLERGKVGDVVLFDGDPFEYTSHVMAVVAAGEVAFER